MDVPGVILVRLDDIGANTGEDSLPSLPIPGVIEMSRLTDFYRGAGTDSEGRTIAEIWAFSDEQWEVIHDFIQWLFPTPAPSRFNPDAPLLTGDEVAEFRDDPGLKASLRRSFDLFLGFLGLRLEGGHVTRAPDFDGKDVFQYPDHNWLRITRVLTSTRLLGLEEESRAFFEFLRTLRESGRSAITRLAFQHWEHAVQGGPGADLVSRPSAKS